MNSLAEEAMEAHGGLQTWLGLDSFSGHVGGGGKLFDAVGQPDGFRSVSFQGQCQEQRMSCWPIAQSGSRSLIEPAYQALLDGSGAIISERADPQAGFAKVPPGELAKWDDHNLAWFIEYALWNYMAAPFIWSWPGVEAEQIASVDSDDGPLRRLMVRYPRHIATHSTEELFYLSRDGLIVRVDYAPVVTGGRLAANLASDHQKVPGGIVVPLCREIFSRSPDGTVKGPSILRIQVDGLRYEGMH